MAKYETSTLSPDLYLDRVAHRFSEAGDPARANGQYKYMREQFPYYGLRNPEVRIIAKDIFRELGIFRGQTLRTLVRKCFERKHREMHYFGILMYESQLRYEDVSSIDFLEELVCTCSWWDTVDWLSSLVGRQLKKFPELKKVKGSKWIRSENIWLQRLAIIFQLKYKDATNTDLLLSHILYRADSKEFFVQKAAGWALREYSKTDGRLVRQFVADNKLPALTKREAMKWLRQREK